MTAKDMQHSSLAPVLRSLCVCVCASSHAVGASVCSTSEVGNCLQLLSVSLLCPFVALLQSAGCKAAPLLSPLSLRALPASVGKPEWTPAQLNYCVIQNTCCRAFESFTLNRDKSRVCLSISGSELRVCWPD